MLSSVVCPITGIMMLSWNCPPVAPLKATVWSLPITRAATCIRLSHITGFTLPGMIELPGLAVGQLDLVEAAARAGAQPADVVGHVEQRDGDRPQLAVALDQPVALGVGLEVVRPPRRRRCRFPRASDSRHAAAELRVRVDAGADRRAAERAAPARPPCAAPPIADSSNLPGKPPNLLAQPQRRGVGQMRAADLDDACPTRAAFSAALPRSRSSAGIKLRAGCRPATATWMAVGKMSLRALPHVDVVVGVDRLRTAKRSPPTISMARLAITSLAFMLLEVPEPVWNTSTGNWSSSLPSATSRQAANRASTCSS